MQQKRLIELARMKKVPTSHRHSIDLGRRINLEDEILVNMTVHGPGESMCCPSVRVIKSFAVREDRLVAAGEKIPGPKIE
jgi:hypothetical protein